MPIEVVPLTEHIGAEIRGVDLGKPVDEATRKEIYAAWLKHLVVLFRGQELTQEQFLAASGNFGKIAKLGAAGRVPPARFRAAARTSC